MDVTRTDQHEVAKFCSVLPHLVGSARAEGWAPVLDEVVARLRTDEGVDPVAVLSDFWRSLGGMRQTRGPAALVGQDPTPPPRGDYRCPRDRCDRAERRAPGGPLPECAVFDEPLRFRR